MDKSKDQILELLGQITSSEQHFNGLEAEYRKLASTWLLAALGACGYILTSQTENTIFDPWLLVAVVCFMGSTGIFVLYILDLKVYHQLLDAFFIAGLKIENENRDWLQPVRVNMMRLQDGHGTTKRVLYFYFISIFCLMTIGIVSVWYIEKISHTTWPWLISAVAAALLKFLHWKMTNDAPNKEAIRLVKQYEQSSLKAENKKIDPDYLAPDGSEIRTLLQFPSGGLAHCALPPGKTTQAVKHKTVVELWYILSGEGELWRKSENEESFISLVPGMCINIPIGTHFQFHNPTSEKLEILISTMPAWPGPDEAVLVENYWPFN